jgi:hypothetical protein
MYPRFAETSHKNSLVPSKLHSLATLAIGWYNNLRNWDSMVVPNRDNFVDSKVSGKIVSKVPMISSIYRPHSLFAFVAIASIAIFPFLPYK